MMAAMPDDELERILNGSGFVPQTEKTLVEPDELRAEIEQIRQRGYGFDDEESNLGIFCIAAPIVDHEGKVIAALSISGSKAEFTAEETPTYVEAVRQACQDISARFGGKHPPALIRS
jgi:IclR family transcriptional regulator, acetate operon repressor